MRRMTIWLIRAGARGDHEQKRLDEGRSYVAWVGLKVDLGSLPVDPLSCRPQLSY